MQKLLSLMLLLSTSQASATIVEWAPFTISKSVTTDQLLDASEKFQKYFLNEQKGFIKRELLHEKGKNWIDVVHWENEEAAQAVLKKAEKSDLCALYFSLMEGADPTDPNVGIKHYNLKKTWSKQIK